MTPPIARNSSVSGSSAADPAPLYGSVWEWMRGVLVAIAVAALFVYLLIKWLDYVHRHQYLSEQEDKQRRTKMRSLLGNFVGDPDDNYEDDIHSGGGGDNGEYGDYDLPLEIELARRSRSKRVSSAGGDRVDPRNDEGSDNDEDEVTITFDENRVLNPDGNR